MTTITITRPDDWHLHVRDGAMLQSVIAHTAREFKRAVIMPNLVPPVTTVEQALAYRQRILAALPAGSDFEPLMTLYLTDSTSAETIQQAAQNPHIIGAKLYPSGATTNSDSGVTRLSNIMPALEAMAETGLVLQVHGEVTDPHVDIFDREALFIDQILAPLARELPTLKIVLEHITTTDGIEFVRANPKQRGGTLTVHHLLFSRNALFQGGIRPHLYCLPILKHEQHRQVLVDAATSGEACFFLGTDSAPHPQHAKESACGCAGMYTAHAAMPLYASVFEKMGKLDHLEAFASLNGPAFYGLSPNQGQLSLSKTSWKVPTSYVIGSDANADQLIPLCAGETLDWCLA